MEISNVEHLEMLTNKYREAVHRFSAAKQALARAEEDEFRIRKETVSFASSILPYEVLYQLEDRLDDMKIEIMEPDRGPKWKKLLRTMKQIPNREWESRDFCPFEDTKERKKLSDCLDYLVRLGKVERVSQGRYKLLSPSRIHI